MRCASLLLSSVLLVQVAACDPVTSREHGPTTPSFSHQPASGWGAAVKLDIAGTSLLNTAALEGCPNESPDGRTLFFASDRSGNLDIWSSTRNPAGDWAQPVPASGVNSTANDFCPTSLPGGRLLFVSTRTDLPHCGVGTADIFESQMDGSGSWAQPVNLGCTVNSTGNEFSPSYVPAGGGMLFFSSDHTGKHAIYVSLRGADGEWGVPAPVAELNLAGYNSVRPNVSADGREIVFDTDRPATVGGFNIWTAHRDTPHGTWSAPVEAGAGVNSGSNELRASLSRDGRRLYFGSNRDGSFDIFVAPRQ